MLVPCNQRLTGHTDGSKKPICLFPGKLLEGHMRTQRVIGNLLLVTAIALLADGNYSDSVQAQIMCVGCGGGGGKISCFHCVLKVTPDGYSEYCGDAPCGVTGSTGCTMQDGHCIDTGSPCKVL
jgi:hypothetical protein